MNMDARYKRTCSDSQFEDRGPHSVGRIGCPLLEVLVDDLRTVQDNSRLPEHPEVGDITYRRSCQPWIALLELFALPY